MLPSHHGSAPCPPSLIILSSPPASPLPTPPRTPAPTVALVSHGEQRRRALPAQVALGRLKRALATHQRGAQAAEERFGRGSCGRRGRREGEKLRGRQEGGNS
ncbi:unnamed protein product [Closterium sp. NIES-64]|nr:unnamed protein product [Closterium sp. NIES-64]